VDSSLLLFVVNATIGAFLNVIMWAKSPSELKGFEAIKTILVGAIAGYLYWFGHQEHGLPDGMMAIVVGYCGKDVVEWIIEKFAPWKGQAQGQAQGSPAA